MLTQGDALGYVLLGFQPVFDLIISFTGQQLILMFLYKQQTRPGSLFKWEAWRILLLQR